MSLHGICDTCGVTDVDLVLVNAPPVAVNVCVCAKCLPTTTKDMLRVSVADGKYTVVQDASGRLSALRYGEPWRNCVGDNLIHALACEVDALRSQIAQLQANTPACGACAESLWCGSTSHLHTCGKPDAEIFVKEIR